MHAIDVLPVTRRFFFELKVGIQVTVRFLCGGENVDDVTPRGRQMSRRAVKLRGERFAALGDERLHTLAR